MRKPLILPKPNPSKPLGNLVKIQIKKVDPDIASLYPSNLTPADNGSIKN